MGDTGFSHQCCWRCSPLVCDTLLSKWFLGPLDSDDRRTTRQTIRCRMPEDLISHEIISSE